MLNGSNDICDKLVTKFIENIHTYVSRINQKRIKFDVFDSFVTLKLFPRYI